MGSGLWLVTGYRESIAVLTDPRFIKTRHQSTPSYLNESPSGTITKAAGIVSNMMLFRDPPDHTRLRALVQQAFIPAKIGVFRPIIEDIATDLIYSINDSGNIDIVANYASLLPMAVIGCMVGIPR